MNRPVITLLTDFGLMDHYVAAMKGVILGISPDANLVDISHEIAPYAVMEGAWTLAQTWRYFPAGTVHLVVVDPGVGSARRAIIAEAAGHRFVSPDNGVLSMVFEAASAHEVREIAKPSIPGPVSQTFHGRDIFAPIAAYLAEGAAAESIGPLLQDYVRLDIPPGTVVKVDRFGNVITNFHVPRGRYELQVGERVISRLASSYAQVEPGELFLIRGSSGTLEISINQGNAAKELGVRSGDTLTLRTL